MDLDVTALLDNLAVKIGKLNVDLSIKELQIKSLENEVLKLREELDVK